MSHLSSVLYCAFYRLILYFISSLVLSSLVFSCLLSFRFSLSSLVLFWFLLFCLIMYFLVLFCLVLSCFGFSSFVLSPMPHLTYLLYVFTAAICHLQTHSDTKHPLQPVSFLIYFTLSLSCFNSPSSSLSPFLSSSLFVPLLSSSPPYVSLSIHLSINLLLHHTQSHYFSLSFSISLTLSLSFRMELWPWLM